MPHQLSFLKKIFLMIFFLLSATTLYTEEQNSFEMNQKESLTVLKSRIFQYLQGSWCSNEKANLIMDHIVLNKPQVCVEIGSFTGSSFLPIVAALSYIDYGHAYAIDAWSNYQAVQGISSTDSHYIWWSPLKMYDIKKQFIKTMNNDWSLTSFYTTVHKPSRNAISLFDTIDFLHIDGNFSETGSIEDVSLYLPKVPSGGYILLSNVFYLVNNAYSKMKALAMLLDQCEVITLADNQETILFRKI